MIYFDYNATTPMFASAKHAMINAMEIFANPSSIHGSGRAARAIVERTRYALASYVNCPPASVVFTSSGTESNNMVLRGFNEREVLISAIEHPSLMNIYPSCDTIACTPEGVIDCEDCEKKLATGRYRLICVMLVNNETGIVQPIADIVRLARTYGVLVHCDAVQALGKPLPGSHRGGTPGLDMQELDLDFMTVSAHKIGGPKGIAALIMKPELTLPVFMRGAGQERRRRAGTENVPAIAGFGAALDAITAVNWDCVDVLHRRLESGVNAQNLTIIGEGSPRLSTTTLISFGVENTHTVNNALVLRYDLAGVAVSTGSACSSGKVGRSHVLDAMGYKDARVIRVSIGWFTSANEIDQFLAVTQKIHTHVPTYPIAHSEPVYTHSQ